MAALANRPGSYDVDVVIAQSRLDELWDFADPVGSQTRLEAAAAETGGAEGDD